MQILETSVLGLRSARISLKHRDTGIVVTLFPMVHIGEEAFYNRVATDALTHEVVLFEGVRSKKTRSLTASYRWIDTDRLGLVVQPRLPDHADSRLVHADILPEEADQLWKRMPLWLRALISGSARAFGLYQRVFATRTSIAKGMSKDLLRLPEEILEEGDELQPLRDLIHVARDKKLLEVLDAELATCENGDRIAVVYGAGHMAAVVRHLATRGFTTLPSEWMTIFTAD